ncbi:DUF2238 domain-containing protein [Candidatus Kaiserbacteria bacterium]|nr:DUF2238 domain-containing protein [Candidatus Kaiserbacteria bacterium]
MTMYQKILAAAFVFVWILSAIHPFNRTDWMLENVLVLIFIPVILIAGRYFRLSDLSYTFIALYLSLHVIGSHWGYASVPFGDLLQHLLDTPRNMYDRFVHFSFGFLIAYPIREIFIRVTGARGVWSYYFPLDIVLSLSALYEIFEWIAAITIQGPVAITFLGAQGDVWDTQKDMASAAVGAVIMIAILLIVSLVRNGGSMAEMRESLKIHP